MFLLLYLLDLNILSFVKRRNKVCFPLNTPVCGRNRSSKVSLNVINQFVNVNLMDVLLRFLTWFLFSLLSFLLHPFTPRPSFSLSPPLSLSAEFYTTQPVLEQVLSQSASLQGWPWEGKYIPDNVFKLDINGWRYLTRPLLDVLLRCQMCEDICALMHAHARGPALDCRTCSARCVTPLLVFSDTLIWSVGSKE